MLESWRQGPTQNVKVLPHYFQKWRWKEKEPLRTWVRSVMRMMGFLKATVLGSNQICQYLSRMISATTISKAPSSRILLIDWMMMTTMMMTISFPLTLINRRRYFWQMSQSRILEVLWVEEGWRLIKIHKMLGIGAEQLLNQVLSGIENLDQVFFWVHPKYTFTSRNSWINTSPRRCNIRMNWILPLLRCWIWDNLF